jgi:hypothetical protein
MDILFCQISSCDGDGLEGLIYSPRPNSLYFCTPSFAHDAGNGTGN